MHHMKKTLFLLITSLLTAMTLTAQRTHSPLVVDLFRETPVLFNPADYPDGLSHPHHQHS